ncbi:MAG: hypothetical protein AB1627_02550 [Chloroflexota bacterium]
MASDGDLDIRMGELPEVLPWGVHGFVVTGSDGEPDYVASMDAAYEQQAVVIQEGIRAEAEDRARSYLSKNGDAIWRRVDPLLVEASALLPEHPGASLTVCLTACELIIRFLLVRPLLGGLVFDDALAERLAREATTGRTNRDREILAMLNSTWELRLDRLKLKDGTNVWPLLSDLVDRRNGYVHRGEPVDEVAAQQANRCADQLVAGLVGPLASRLGLRWPEGDWLEDWDVPGDPFAKARKS